MRVQLKAATVDQAPAIAALRSAAALDLTARYGHGPWSSIISARGVLFDMRRGTVYLATHRKQAIATLILSTRKPWAIDKTYFTSTAKPLYLTSMAVDPTEQRSGIGRRCLRQLSTLARQWPGDAIRLDAWDAEAGAGGFYDKCGFREVGRAPYRNAPLIYFELLL